MIVFLSVAVVFVVIVAVAVVVGVAASRRNARLRHLEDPRVAHTEVDHSLEVTAAQARAARPDGGMGLPGGPS